MCGFVTVVPHLVGHLIPFPPATLGALSWGPARLTYVSRRSIFPISLPVCFCKTSESCCKDKITHIVY